MTQMDPAFHKLTGELDYPMLIVTTIAGEEKSGCLVGFATQCSIGPPRFLVCLSDKNHTHHVAQRAEALGVHFIPADGVQLAELFGHQTDDRVDKFARCEWHAGPYGVPILDGSARWFVGRIRERHMLGDHTGFLLDPLKVKVEGPPDVYTFRQARGMEPGHTP